MTELELFEAFGKANSKLLEESELRPSVRHGIWYMGAAACIALCALSAVVIRSGTGNIAEERITEGTSYDTILHEETGEVLAPETVCEDDDVYPVTQPADEADDVYSVTQPAISYHADTAPQITDDPQYIYMTTVSDNEETGVMFSEGEVIEGEHTGVTSETTVNLTTPAEEAFEDTELPQLTLPKYVTVEPYFVLFAEEHGLEQPFDDIRLAYDFYDTQDNLSLWKTVPADYDDLRPMLDEIGSSPVEGFDRGLMSSSIVSLIFMHKGEEMFRVTVGNDGNAIVNPSELSSYGGCVDFKVSPDMYDRLYQLALTLDGVSVSDMAESPTE